MPFDYLMHRREKAATSGMSPKMLATINELNSRMATRPQMQAAQVKSGLAVRNISLQKAARRAENAALAKHEVNLFLHKSQGVSQAQGLKDELEKLGQYLKSIAPNGVQWIPGPLKKLDKAMGKTIEDYDYAWGLNKDLVRGTLACKSNEDLAIVARDLQATCTPEFGMFLIKADHQESIRDGGAMKSGYSGWNFVVQFKEHKVFGGEIQANTFDLLYGKHSKKEVMEHLHVSPDEYAGMQARLKFPGGLGHALYDIQDIARSKATVAEGDWARELALDYNDACRGQFRKCTLQALNDRIMATFSHLTSPVAKALWKHGVEGSGWMMFQIAH